MSFSRDLDNFHTKAIGATENIIRGAMLDVFTAIILTTPVDKGVLRNGWFVSFEQPSTQLPTDASGNAQQVVGRTATALDAYRIDVRTAYFVNNLPYAVPIEFDGHSAQAPEGMVRINTARWEQIVRANVRKFT